MLCVKGNQIGTEKKLCLNCFFTIINRKKKAILEKYMIK